MDFKNECVYCCCHISLQHNIFSLLFYSSRVQADVYSIMPHPIPHYCALTGKQFPRMLYMKELHIEILWVKQVSTGFSIQDYSNFNPMMHIANLQNLQHFANLFENLYTLPHETKLFAQNFSQVKLAKNVFILLNAGSSKYIHKKSKIKCQEHKEVRVHICKAEYLTS